VARSGAAEPGRDTVNQRPLITAGVLLGIGLGGFIDGIVFHQLLQVHNMLSARVPPDTLINAKINMFWDGIFHVFTWTLAVLGVFQLWNAGRQDSVLWSGRTLLGAMLAGWGAFNVVEAVIDHYILHIHHLVESLGLSVYDHMFLAFGIVLVVIGVALIHRAGREAKPRVYPLGGA
jgi:uncharacterized membrane protein